MNIEELESKIERELGIELPNGIEAGTYPLQITDRGFDLLSIEHPESFENMDENELDEWTVEVEEGFQALADNISRITGLQWEVDDLPVAANYKSASGEERYWVTGIVCKKEPSA